LWHFHYIEHFNWIKNREFSIDLYYNFLNTCQNTKYHFMSYLKLQLHFGIDFRVIWYVCEC
jgi:hypothetical protein